MPLTNPFASPDEVRDTFDQELAEARRSGKLPEFFTYALRKEIVLRSEAVQLLVTKLADWLVQETELRNKVAALEGRQEGAVARLGSLVSAREESVRDREELRKGIEQVAALLGNSQTSIADWHRRHASEHRDILMAIRTQSLLSQKRNSELAGAVSELSGLVGEALGRLHTQAGASTSQAMKLGKIGGYGGAGYIVFRIIELIITFLAK